MASALAYIILTSWALVALATTLGWFYLSVRNSHAPAPVRIDPR